MSSADKTITVQYFALLRELRGCAQETLETPAETPLDLYLELKRQYHFPLEPSMLRVAINDAFAAWEAPLKSQDVVVFIPPVAGG